MEEYKGSKKSGVTAYEIFEDTILLKFNTDPHPYVYDNVKPGKKHVEKMKELAIIGKGLAIYINKYVRDNYRTKL